ncbi:hypothetical protein [Pseudomarimonas arenosa]|uniref:Uncharacterized protein n=1 Tax=Pseudomarimonas arenosa TaxID=2774145 RepID=A0AAW3ZPM7_9GAMM|nr:hypothetical protein [Pseudomarimonas arenosa]MBD8527678.1 hypothetical protein [Pseudomarimonas arenosa]
MLAWAAGAFVGSAMAAQLSRCAPLGPCLAVGVAMLLGTAVSLWMIPHPMWMAAAGLLLPLPIGCANARRLPRRGH